MNSPSELPVDAILHLMLAESLLVMAAVLMGTWIGYRLSRWQSPIPSVPEIQEKISPLSTTSQALQPSPPDPDEEERRRMVNIFANLKEKHEHADNV